MEERKVQVANAESIQAKLDKKLGPEYISKRIGHGTSRVAYIEGWKAINLANQIFGYNGWSTEVKSVTVDFMDEHQNRYCIGCTAIVRVTLSDGTFREDIGYGTVENERRKSSAFEKAKKSAVTDALKRSLRGFGNALGNCLYDKDFLSKIDKVKFHPPDFDEGNLFRPTDELSEVSRSNTVLDHIEGPVTKKKMINDNKHSTLRSNTRIYNTEYETPKNLPTNNVLMDSALQKSNQETEDLLDDSFMFSDDLQDEDLMNVGTINETGKSNSVPLEFVTAKAAQKIQQNIPITNEQIFDPKFQAQSIKHTVDQTVSTHIKASVLKNHGVERNKIIYSKFAPKGKQLDNEDTPINDSETSTNTGDNYRPTLNETSVVTVPETSTLNNTLTPLKRNNGNSHIIPIRREVGKPRVDHPNLKKSI